MDKSTRLIILAVCLLIFSFEITNILVSNTDLSGNYVIEGVTKVERRSIRLGATTDFGLMYPLVISFQDLILLLVGGFLVVVLYLDKKDINLKSKASKKYLILSSIATFALFLALNLQYSYRFSFEYVNEWSIYYLTQFCFMISLMFLFTLAYAYGKKNKIKLLKSPKAQFITLVASLFAVGLLIGFFDSFYTGGIIFKFFDNIFGYGVTTFLLLATTAIATISFIALPTYFKMKDKNIFYYLFIYFATYATGLWFLSWHFVTGTLIPQLQHPLPFRIYPFAIYWESWMDYWLMVVSIVVFSIVSYMIYKRIKK